MKSSRMALFLAVTIGVSGCYGPFNLTRKLHRWNGEVGGKWANEAVFLGLVLVPAYAFATLGDVLIFNSVEFWTGKNPVASDARSFKDGDRQAVMKYDAEAARLRVDSFEKGRLKSTLVLSPEGESLAARDKTGALVMTAKTEDGLVVLRDAAGRVVSRRSPSELRTLTQ